MKLKISICVFLFLMALSSQGQAVSINIGNGTCYNYVTGNETIAFCAPSCPVPEHVQCIPAWSNVSVQCQSPEFKPNSTYVGELVDCYKLQMETLSNLEKCQVQQTFIMRDIASINSSVDSCNADVKYVTSQLESIRASDQTSVIAGQLEQCKKDVENAAANAGSCLNDKNKADAQIASFGGTVTNYSVIAFIIGIAATLGFQKWKERQKHPDDPRDPSKMS